MGQWTSTRSSHNFPGLACLYKRAQRVVRLATSSCNSSRTQFYDWLVSRCRFLHHSAVCSTPGESPESPQKLSLTPRARPWCARRLPRRPSCSETRLSVFSESICVFKHSYTWCHTHCLDVRDASYKEKGESK